jgi:hypothetical protein
MEIDRNQITIQMVEKFTLFLKNQGLPDEDILDFLEKFTRIIVDDFKISIARIMTEDDVKRWEAFLATDPNELQQYAILEEFYKIKTERTFDDLWNDIFQQKIQTYITELQNDRRLHEKISKLSEEQKVLMRKYIDNKEFDKISALLSEE